MLRNNKESGIVSAYAIGATKSAAGNFINTLEIPTMNLPGNFGVRAIEVMPTNLSDVWRDRKNTQLAYVCLEEFIKVPEIMD